MRQRFRQRGKRHVHLAANQVGDRRRTALVRNVQQLDTGPALKHQARQVDQVMSEVRGRAFTAVVAHAQNKTQCVELASVDPRYPIVPIGFYVWAK